MRYILAILAFFAAIGAEAQTAPSFSEAAVIRPFSLDITFHKTTVLIFPAAIQSADRGDSYVLAEKVKGAANVLKVKAGQKDFEQSNLQVITHDGKVYAFTVNYAAQPAALTIDLRKQPPYAPVSFKGLSLNSKEIEKYADIAAAGSPFMSKGKYTEHGMAFRLQGIYIKDDVLFLRYQLRNHTGIRYDAASMRFYVRDKKLSKRTAVQDREIVPVHIGYTGKPEDADGQTIVAAFPKFTIAEKKRFIAELMERDGDRNPVSRLDQKLLLKARPLK